MMLRKDEERQDAIDALEVKMVKARKLEIKEL